VLSSNGKVALQYGPTDGYLPLRQWIADSLSGGAIVPEQVLMTSGSQQALDLLGKVLIDEGSRVLVETPSYLGALQAFSVYRPEFKSVDTDEAWCRRRSPSPKARACCTRCPTSRTRPAALSVERRVELVETCARLGLPLIEDDPYGALSYRASRTEDGGDEPGRRDLHGFLLQGADPGIRLGYVVRRCRWCAAWNWPSRRPTCTPRS
jgi:2-aminoadipate transaminase